MLVFIPDVGSARTPACGHGSADTVLKYTFMLNIIRHICLSCNVLGQHENVLQREDGEQKQVKGNKLQN